MNITLATAATIPFLVFFKSFILVALFLLNFLIFNERRINNNRKRGQYQCQ